MRRVLATLHILGLTMVMFALTMLIPLGVAYIGGDAARDAFLHGFLISEYLCCDFRYADTALLFYLLVNDALCLHMFFKLFRFIQEFPLNRFDCLLYDRQFCFL